MASVDQAKGAMSDNISSAMSNLESADQLMDKTNHMSEQSNSESKASHPRQHRASCASHVYPGARLPVRLPALLACGHR